MIVFVILNYKGCFLNFVATFNWLAVWLQSELSLLGLPKHEAIELATLPV
jgi:hypothetical protein